MCALLALATAIYSGSSALAVISTDQIMSAQTRGYVSIDDIDRVSERWQQTQLGQLIKDEAMRPFIEDMKRQIRSKFANIEEKLGLKFSDLQDVAGGELGLGLVERPAERAALALVVNITGHQARADALLEKVERKLTERGATKETTDAAGTMLTTYTIAPQSEKEIEQTVLYFVKDGMLCVCDSASEAREMLKRFDKRSEGRLVEVEAYQQIMRRSAKAAGRLQPEIRWFVDPFGYAHASRSLARAGTERRGKDYLKILATQGFDAIQGIGGFINFSAYGSVDLLHRTMVYAPPIKGLEDKYRLAMRMMEFPNRTDMRPQDWLPDGLATYRTFNCNLSGAFEHVGSLFDAIAGYEKAFEGVLKGMEEDAYGPQVDVRKDFIAHLGERVSLITDHELPITTECERFLFVIELINEDAFANTMKKYMDCDPNALAKDYQGKTIWEIHEPQGEFEELDIGISDLDLLVAGDDVPADEMIDDSVPPSAVCVTDGHLFIASHVDFLERVLDKDRPKTGLTEAGDFRKVQLTLSKLLSGPTSANCFLRTDEAYRPTYELLRQGKMPESETLLGRLLNRMMTPADDEEILREQKIDGRKLPEFERVRRYFGPAGTAIRSTEDGWFIVGATLSKQAPQARAGNKLTDTQSAVR